MQKKTKDRKLAISPTEDPDFVQSRDIADNLESWFALTRILPSGSSATKDRISLMREIGDCREKGFKRKRKQKHEIFSRETLGERKKKFLVTMIEIFRYRIFGKFN